MENLEKNEVIEQKGEEITYSNEKDSSASLDTIALILFKAIKRKTIEI